MCEPTILHENNFGHIMKCDSCNEIQICLGNIITNVSTDGFYGMKKVINQISIDRADRGFDYCPRMKVMIKTPVEQLWIAFTKKEFEMTSELFEMSNIMLQTENALISN